MQGPLIMLMVWLAMLLMNYASLQWMYRKREWHRKFEPLLYMYLQATGQLEHVTFVAAMLYAIYDCDMAADRAARLEDFGTYFFLVCYWLILRRQKSFLRQWEKSYVLRTATQ